MTTVVTTASSGPLTASGVTAIPFTFQAISATEITATRNGVLASASTYTVTLNTDGTGSITPTTSWGTDSVNIYSSPDYTQPISFAKYGAFYPDQINTPLDRLARAILALRDSTALVPPYLARANRILGWDAAGLPTTYTQASFVGPASTAPGPIGDVTPAATAAATAATTSATSAGNSATSASTSATTATTQATLSGTNATAASTSAAIAQAYNAGAVFASTADAMSNGVIGTTSLVAGSGGTNGTFDVTFSGGGGTGAAARFTVTGGALVSIIVTAKGINYTSAPTMVFTASTGLTGASAVAQTGINVAIGNPFILQGTGNTYGTLYRNVAGTATSQNVSIPSLAALSAAGGNPAAVRERLGIFNAFDIAGVVTGHLISNGVDSVTAGYNVTGFIPCEPGSIVFSIGNAFTAQYGAMFYDATKTFIAASNTSTVVAGTPITAPAGAAYVQTSYGNAVDLTLLQVVRGTTLPTVFQPFGNPLDIPNFVSARTAVEDRITLRLSLFNPANLTAGSSINNTGAIGTNANYFVTNYMPVTPGGTFTTYPASYSLPSGYGPTFYDKNKARVSNSSTDSPWAANTTFTVPSNAYYVRMTAHNSLLSTFVAVPGSAAVVRLADHKPAVLNDANQWAGKNFCFLGDSLLAAGGGWPVLQLMPLIGGLLDTKHAAYTSGRGIAAALTDQFSVAFVSGDFTNIDYTHIELVTNNIGMTLGAITDTPSSSATTFFGLYKYVIETLRGWNDAMRITLQTPFYRGDSAGAQWTAAQPFIQAVKDLGVYYSLAVWEADKVGGWGPGNVAVRLQADLIHPTTAGITNGCLPALRSFIMSQYPNVA